MSGRCRAGEQKRQRWGKVMSGICAILNLDRSPVPPTEVERMANALRPYGPDRQKSLLRGNAAFVFCLHQLTPEDTFEQQPLVLANRFVMLFDGRIDNRHELSEALSIAASDLNWVPDSVIAMRLFDRWGEQAFERILGDFAIIVMDLQEGHLICVRDQMGSRVLHYHLSATRFAVATNPETLFALSWVPRIWNKDKVADTLVNCGLNEETTYYQEIFRVPPGSIIRVRSSGLSKAQFWNPEKIPDVRFKSDHEYVEAFRERLHAAVKARLRSRRAPCAAITGGLDSSSIAVVAADMLAAEGNKLDTFTAVPEAGFSKEDTRGIYFDETPFVRQIAELNGNITPHLIRPSRGPILKQIADEIRVGGVPSGGILNGLWVMDISAAARSLGHNVMLVGEMGNLTMSNDGRGLLAELVRTGRWLKLFSEIASSGHRWRHMIRHYTLAPFVPSRIFRIYKQWGRGGKPPWYEYSAIQPAFAAQSGIVDRAAREYFPFDAPPHRDSRLARIHDFHIWCETADWFAKIRANFGIDPRTPAFDRRLVEFCLGIPDDQYRRGGRERWLIKRTMQGRLPDSVLSNTKRGYQASDWFVRLTREREQIIAEVKRLTGNPEVSEIIDLQRLIEVMDHWPEQEPTVFSDEQRLLMWIPQALGAANFIERVTGVNYGAIVPSEVAS
jgi:asparagine synthase (glutamine-hydrolysing)